MDTLTDAPVQTKENTDVIFNPRDIAFLENPYSTYSHLRENNPFFYHEETKGWIATRYCDVAELMSDSRFSTSMYDWMYFPPRKPESEMSEFEKLLDNNVFQLSQESHRRLRKLALPAFSDDIMNGLREPIRELAHQTFDKISNLESFDYAEEVSKPISIRTVGKLLGVPDDKLSAFQWTADAVQYGMNPLVSEEERAKAAARVPEGLAIMREFIEFRKSNPDGKFLSTLITTRVEDDGLTSWEILSIFGSLIAVSLTLASDLLNKLVWTLASHNDQLNLLRQQPDLVKNAIREVQRYQTFGGLGFRRYALEDVEVKGNVVKKGEMVCCVMGSALRDPEMFDAPDVFDIQRNQKNNIGYGRGFHTCIGKNIAQIQSEVVLSTFLERFSEFELQDKPIFAHYSLSNVIEELWVQAKV